MLILSYRISSAGGPTAISLIVPQAKPITSDTVWMASEGLKIGFPVEEGRY